MFSDESKPQGKGLFENKWDDANKVSQEEHFSAVSVTAILSLIGGVLSLLYFVNHSLFYIPLITLLLVIGALWSIRRSEGTLTGAALARIALFLLLVPIVAGAFQSMIYRRHLILQAREFFPLVIQAAQKGDALTLQQLEKFQPARDEVRDEAAYWADQVKDPIQSIQFYKLIRNPTLLTLAALGENARITYDRTLSVAKDSSDGSDHIISAYAVTFSEFGEKKTFFIPLYGIRTHDAENHASLWRRGSFASEPLKPSGFSSAESSDREK